MFPVERAENTSEKELRRSAVQPCPAGGLWIEENISFNWKPQISLAPFCAVFAFIRHPGGGLWTREVFYDALRVLEPAADVDPRPLRAHLGRHAPPARDPARARWVR